MSLKPYIKLLPFLVSFLSNSLIFSQSSNDKGSLKYATVRMNRPENGYYSEDFKVKYRFINCFGEVGLNIAIIPESLNTKSRDIYYMDGVRYLVDSKSPNYHYKPSLAYLEVSLHQENKSMFLGAFLGKKRLGAVNNWDIAGCFGQTYTIIGMINKDAENSLSIDKIDEAYYLKNLDEIEIVVAMYESIRNGEVESEIKANLKKKKNEELNKKVDWHIKLGDSQLKLAKGGSKEYYCKKALLEYNKALAFMPNNEKAISRIREASFKCKKENKKKNEKIDDFWKDKNNDDVNSSKKDNDFRKDKNQPKLKKKDDFWGNEDVNNGKKSNSKDFWDETSDDRKPDGFYDSNKKGHKIETKNGKQGVVDQNGRVVIPFKYNKVYYYKNGLAKVKIDQKNGYLGSVKNCLFDYSYSVYKICFVNKSGLVVSTSEKTISINSYGGYLVVDKTNKNLSDSEKRRLENERKRKCRLNLNDQIEIYLKEYLNTGYIVKK